MADYPALSQPHVFVLQVGSPAWADKLKRGTLPSAVCVQPMSHLCLLPACPSGPEAAVMPALVSCSPCPTQHACRMPCRAGTRRFGRRTASCARVATPPWTTPTSRRSSRWAGVLALSLWAGCTLGQRAKQDGRRRAVPAETTCPALLLPSAVLSQF